MTSLTPQKDAEETVWGAMKEGFVSGGLMAIPSSLGVYAAMNYSPKFVKSTNWQSRTALVIMPPLFAFAAGAENKLVHSMKAKASERDHSKAMAAWSQQTELAKHREQLQRMSTQKILSQPGMEGSAVVKDDAHEKKIAEKFRESVVDSGVRVVSGESLGVHHQAANFFQENPFKLLAAIGVPTVYYIFKGKEGQKHLPTQLKIMHTRVFGQFAVLSMLLTLMGFKEYMDRSGKFITEDDVQARIGQMQQSRQELIMRLQRDKMDAKHVAEKRRQAHAADLKTRETKKLLEDA